MYAPIISRTERTSFIMKKFVSILLCLGLLLCLGSAALAADSELEIVEINGEQYVSLETARALLDGVSPSEAGGTIVLKGARLLSADYNGEELDVLVQDGYIVAVGEDLAGDTVIDLTGYTLMPGMIDAHVHIASGSGYGMDLLAQFCEQGITSVREEGMLSTGDEAEFLPLIEEANEDPANA